LLAAAEKALPETWTRMSCAGQWSAVVAVASRLPGAH